MPDLLLQLFLNCALANEVWDVAMRNDLASLAPRLGVIVPVFGHSSLLLEAIESVLAQRFDGGLRLVLVNDGCQLIETDEVCYDYSSHYPDVVTYLRKANGGLSDARNCGIRYILEHLPSIEGIFMLDADNRLLPYAMARAIAAFDSDPNVDWIYPDIDTFGTGRALDHGGEYSLLIHSVTNICEAGSLIRRRVFEAGVFFDTDFRVGWEDWDFFLNAARRGFRGKNIEGFGFLYRYRPESMLADATRQRSVLLDQLRRRHADLYQLRTLLSLEQIEAPRYIIHVGDQDQDQNWAVYCTDPCSSAKSLTSAQFEEEYWRSQVSGCRFRTPSFNVLLTSDLLEELRECGLLHWVLWLLETISDDTRVSVLKLSYVTGCRLSVSVEEDSHFWEAQGSETVVFLTTELFSWLIQERGADWMAPTSEGYFSRPVRLVSVTLPRVSPDVAKSRRPTVLNCFARLVQKMREAPWSEAAKHEWGYRESQIRYRGNEYSIVRKECGGVPIFPRCADGKLHIGFLFSGVHLEVVNRTIAIGLARGMKAHGWVPHAFVLDSDEFSMSDDWNDVFASTNLLGIAGFDLRRSKHQTYMGTDLPEGSVSDRLGTLAGALHWLSAAVNFNCPASFGDLSQLRRVGVKIANVAHSLESTPLGRPVGNPYLSLAYEHAIDVMVGYSADVCDWLHGMGVPREKIVLVRGVNGIAARPDGAVGKSADRQARNLSGVLRVLYLLGKDAEELGRLTECVCLSRNLQVSVRCCIIPESPADDANGVEPETESAELCLRKEDLEGALGWADVLVLLSNYDPGSLVVLEAMQAGIVVIAVNKGRTPELLRSKESGFLVDERTAVDECIGILGELASNRQRLISVSRRAQEASERHIWREATLDLARSLSPLS